MKEGSGVLRRPGKSPEWVQELLREFTKPPYFLQFSWSNLQGKQQSSTEKKTTQAEPSQSPEKGSESPVSAPSQPSSATLSPRPEQVKAAHKSAQSVYDTAPQSVYGLGAKPVYGPSVKPARPGNSHSEIGGVTEMGTAATTNQDSQLAAKQTGLPTASPQTTAAPENERSWQAVLHMHGIPVGLPTAYGWNVTRAVDLGGAVRVMTQKASYTLKKTHIPMARVAFLQQLLTYVESQGFTRFAPFQPTKRNKYSLSRGDHVFYATQWLQGRQVTFSSAKEVGWTAQTLAQFHELSRGFEAQGYNPPAEFDLAGMLRRRSQDLHALLMRAEVATQPDEFDRLLRDIAPALREDADRSVQWSDDVGAQSFLTADEEKCGVCHLDVIPENFILRSAERVYALDFDLATFAPRVLDVSHLLRRSLQRQNWSESVAYECFLQYNEVRPFTTPEYIWVQSLLTFPYRAWRTAHTRYRMWKEPSQLEELREFAREAERRKIFLQALANQIQH
ncbi:hypothetical protein D2Q93_07480 [Alicyclobacillaceae bacterium I2511]|nr:hypothetical protein D2Q93_07480 [Alicyclobacillaceae bacterium I2511]